MRLRSPCVCRDAVLSVVLVRGCLFSGLLCLVGGGLSSAGLMAIYFHRFLGFCLNCKLSVEVCPELSHCLRRGRGAILSFLLLSRGC